MSNPPIFQTMNDLSELPDTEAIDLASPGQPTRRVHGRVIARALPCSRPSEVGNRGCGAEDSMMLVRHPVRGLNLPGERIVGLLEHCTECGHSIPLLVTATATEIAQGWAPGTVS